jgi:transcriptional regulator with XRE-family HTH domain
MNETRISELRRERGWTQERLAEETGIAVRTIQRLEAGSDASLDTLSRIARALEVPVRDLFGEEPAALAPEVRGHDERAEAQQERREAETRAWRWAYVAVGLAITFTMIVLTGTQAVPGPVFLIVPAYWAIAAVGSRFLLQIVIEPWLDKRYPLSVPMSSARARERRDRRRA